MAHWIECSDSQGKLVAVNFDAVPAMGLGQGTVILHLGGNETISLRVPYEKLKQELGIKDR